MEDFAYNSLKLLFNNDIKFKFAENKLKIEPNFTREPQKRNAKYIGEIIFYFMQQAFLLVPQLSLRKNNKEDSVIK